MRKIQCINDSWVFVKDTQEEKIDLPHTWNALDGQDGGNDYYRGQCRYKKELLIPKINEDECIYLEFQGVNSIAEVYLNGHKLTTHIGGYSIFRVNITEYVEESNQLEVVVDNSENDYSYPQFADFTFYGGIYRDVHMIICSKSHFALDHHGGSGIKITPEVVGESARIKVESFVIDDYDEIEIIIENEEGLIAKATGNVVELKIENVHLWHGVSDPYLYTLRARLISQGECVDEVVEKFGCRSFSVDPEKGFILNGEVYPLRGVSRHQDHLGIGNALTKENHKEDMALILDVGSNTVRLAHYQHDQYFMKLCDEKGIIVWAEIPYITKHLQNGVENTLSQMKELIVQNYNHPSIVCWGLSNEITAGGKPDGIYDNHYKLQALCHELDGTRLTVMANVFMLSIDDEILDIPDLNSYNLYYGWYVGELEENDQFFDEFHRKYPNRPIGLSEYGAEGILDWQTSNPQKGDYSEQYQALYHEHMCQMIKERPYLWATHVWNMFDFAADARDEGGVKGRNNKGLVSFDRKVKKDAYYVFKAFYSNEPFVHIAGKRYIDRCEDITEVKVYSNQSDVELYNNGQLVSKQEGLYVFSFNVQLDEVNHLKAVSGELSDSSKIMKVATPNEAYILKEEDGISNWFEDMDLKFPEGFYSIKDKMGDLLKTEVGQALISKIMANRSTEKEGVAAAVEISDEMRMKFMKDLTLETILKKADLPVEKIIEINKALTKIKKED